MNQTSVIFPIEKDVAHDAHIHFYDFVESFHGLQNQDAYQIQRDEINEKLRLQYLQDNNYEQKLCFRNCFKLNNRSYVDFCLDQKCGGVEFKKAATIMGYVRQ